MTDDKGYSKEFDEIRAKIAEFHEAKQKASERVGVPNFGVLHLNIKEAAELVTRDLWYSGEMPNKEIEDLEGSEYDQKLLEMLAERSKKFEAQIQVSINKGLLKAAVTCRSFDGDLSLEKTYINDDALISWIEECGYYIGDHISDWIEDEVEIGKQAACEVVCLRAMVKKHGLRSIYEFNDGLFNQNVDEAKIGEVRSAYKTLVIENQLLKDKLKAGTDLKSAKVDRPLTTRQRRTYLIIIEALCKKVAIDSQGRGTAQRIKEMIEILGAPIDDGTIAKLIAEIPDALERRIK